MRRTRRLCVVSFSRGAADLVRRRRRVGVFEASPSLPSKQDQLHRFAPSQLYLSSLPGLMSLPEHLSSLRARDASDERRATSDERQLARNFTPSRTKLQIAIVRTLADELDRCPVRGGAALPIEEQLVQELVRLGCRSLETVAATVEKPMDVTEQSGIHRALAFVQLERMVSVVSEAVLRRDRVLAKIVRGRVCSTKHPPINRATRARRSRHTCC